MTLGRRCLASLMLYGLVASCSDSVGADDLGTTNSDATLRPDAAGPTDSGLRTDATPRSDLGADAGVPTDAEPAADADPTRDADPAADAQPAADVEPAADAAPGADVGPTADAAPGADVDPAADASADAGPAPDAGSASDSGVGPSVCAVPPSAAMSFFVTEDGHLSGDFGGLIGADLRCSQIATAAGITGRTWVAYLSALSDATYGRVDARDRIGAGPWTNHDGVTTGANAAIHGATGIPPSVILTECGRLVEFDANDFGGDPGAHDVFTGSTPQGTLEYIFGDPQFGPGTCGDWTSGLAADKAYVGHTDWGVGDTWNASHITSGCDEESLRLTAANGRLYCFATD